MTFKDLQRLMDQEQSAGTDSKEMQDLLRKLKDRPFYIWSKDRHNAAANPKRTSTKERQRIPIIQL
jgi:predicted amidohydrolase YtcJ